MVILSGFGLLGWGYIYDVLFLQKRVTLTAIWIGCIGNGMSDGFQGLVHFFLTMKYQFIAEKVPILIENRQPEPESTGHKVFYWSMLVINVVIGPLVFVQSFTFNIVYRIHGEDPGTFLVVIDTLAAVMNGFQILLGVILINSVLKIRRFFKERNDEGYIDTAALSRHAACFGSYTLLYTFYNLSFIVYANFPNLITWTIFMFSNIIYLYGNLFSEILLCQIFWSLGSKVQYAKNEIEQEMIIEFVEDEEAELTANMWN